MVHDTRYDLDAGKYSEQFSVEELAAGVNWIDFVAPHDQKLLNGFRPTAVDAKVALAVVNDNIELAITDRSVYSSDDDANYKTEVKTYVYGDVGIEQAALARTGISPAGQPRPTSIDTFSIKAGPVGTSLAWVYDNNPIPWRTVIAEDTQTFTATLANLPAGYRPISLASRNRNGTSEYAAPTISQSCT